MKLGAFVLTYRRPRELRESLHRILGQTRPPDRLLVVDNAGDGETREVAASFGEPVIYEATGANLGSAGGTEYGTRRLLEQGYDWIYSGDDDNPPRTDDTVERLLALLEGAAPDVGGAGTVGARWDWQAGRLRRLPDEALRGPVEVDFIGGDHKLILTRRAAAEGGPPDGRLFFGYPDLEHCLRLRRAGFRLLVDGELMLQYRERVGRVGWSPGRSPVPRRPLNSLWRNYYTTRNYVHMMRVTFDRPDLARREAARTLLRALAAWWRGPRYGATYGRLALRGLVDGYRGRLGRTVEPRPKPGTA